MAERRQRKVFHSTVVSIWLFGTLALGRLASTYVPLGTSPPRGVLPKIVPHGVASAQSFRPTSSAEAIVEDGTFESFAQEHMTGLLAAAAAVAFAVTLNGLGVQDFVPASMQAQTQTEPASNQASETAKVLFGSALSFASAVATLAPVQEEKKQAVAANKKVLFGSALSFASAVATLAPVQEEKKQVVAANKKVSDNMSEQYRRLSMQWKSEDMAQTKTEVDKVLAEVQKKEGLLESRAFASPQRMQQHSSRTQPTLCVGDRAELRSFLVSTKR